MRAAVLPESQDGWRSPVASVALHLVAIAPLVFVAPRPQAPPDTEPSVSVEIVAPPRRTLPEEAPARPSTPDRADATGLPGRNLEAAIPDVPPQAPRAGSQAPPMVRAERMLSQSVLADPRSGAARRELRSLAVEERAVQLCGIEAMEQVHAWKKELLPEAVVAYATKGLKIRGGSIIADGAAFFSGSDWYRLRFECDVRDDKVVSFAYSAGDPIPRSEWEAYSLPEQVQDDD
ncbi:DUF930 domain-containing protein [Mesorhizobium sp. J428]|uniref:DUF930 domain-containing protein n=1 Tax=Mesorhizobium sp. J428 TaxID=2898440 RepID=UPI0021509D03|nr:DUF930 domain-containing protein [Mesorhizobium sp. J428]MCR5859385.1 DUF930 domain-containing protein [Mesorhizobium sp. J428]